MEVMNQTQLRFFVFSGLTDNEKLAPFLFILFLLVYMVTIVGNVGMFTVVHQTSDFHAPMYYFLSCLSMVDLCFSSVVTPKMLCDLLSKMKFISFSGCVLQFLFFATLAGTEAFLLSTMSYDRYIAICQPLHYVSIITKRKCLCLIFLSISLASFQSSVQTTCVFSLRFCGSNIIEHFYCDVSPLLQLSCSRTLPCDIVMVFFTCLCGVGTMTTIFTSYSLIVSSILRIKSAEGRQKAFSTCSAHLTCVSIFYGTTLFIYLRPSGRVFEKQDKVVSVFYLVVIPMLNPLIYSLRNQDVQRAIIRALKIRCI